MPSKLNERVKAARLSMHISQQELADKCGVSRSAVAQWESEAGTNPSRENIANICAVTGAPLEWLMSDDSDINDDGLPPNWKKVPEEEYLPDDDQDSYTFSAKDLYDMGFFDDAPKNPKLLPCYREQNIGNITDRSKGDFGVPIPNALQGSQFINSIFAVEQNMPRNKYIIRRGKTTLHMDRHESRYIFYKILDRSDIINLKSATTSINALIRIEDHTETAKIYRVTNKMLVGFVSHHTKENIQTWIDDYLVRPDELFYIIDKNKLQSAHFVKSISRLLEMIAMRKNLNTKVSLQDKIKLLLENRPLIYLAEENIVGIEILLTLEQKSPYFETFLASDREQIDIFNEKNLA